jgi:transposase
LLEQQIELYFGEMQKICDANFSEAIRHLTTLPGVSQISAMIIIAETGGDMRAFENSGKFTG